MSKNEFSPKDLYYTREHEWIDFQGTVAYVGICHFKLLGFKEVHQVLFEEQTGFKKKGDLLAMIRYMDYMIAVHMPVDGRVMRINEELQEGNTKLLLEFPESNGWIALIVPAQPYERKDLLPPKQYLAFSKGKTHK